MSLYQFILCYASACMHMYMHGHTHSCTHTNTHAHTHALTNTHRGTQTQIHVHAHTHSHTHTHTHTHSHTIQGLQTNRAKSGHCPSLLFMLSFVEAETSCVRIWTCPTTFGPIFQSTKHGQSPVIHCKDLFYSDYITSNVVFNLKELTETQLLCWDGFLTKTVNTPVLACLM